MKKKYKISLVAILVLLIGAIAIATSYALWTVNKEQVGTNVVEAGCFDLNVESENGEINLTNAYPITNDAGMKLQPYVIKIKNNCSIDSRYAVNLEVLPSSDLSTVYVNSAINSGDIKKLNARKSANATIENVTESRELLTGVLAAGDAKSFDLRLWIDESVTIEDTDALEKTLNTKLVVVNSASTTKKYTETILNGTDPVITDSLVPVQISSNGEVTMTSINSSWYNYENKEWANAVALTSSAKYAKGTSDERDYKVGDTIEQSDIESYFVWIPRYKYKLFYNDNYNDVIEGKQTTESNAQEIEIMFENKETTPSNGSLKDEWLTHPAFTSFGVNGLWVGKFSTTGSIDNISIKPGVTVLGNQTISSMFTAAINYNTTLDSHMMKNTEWGAVAYLSHSKYGINKEININNNSALLTGYGATDNADLSSYPGANGTTEDVTQNWTSIYGQLASTTGNITGVYDMAGGTWKAVAAFIPNQSGDHSGFSSNPIDSYGEKYFDAYQVSTIVDYNNRILGDATGELGPFYHWQDVIGTTNYHNSWYTDLSHFVDEGNPWFVRGGMYDNGQAASQFYFYRHNGTAWSGCSFRITLAPTN